jgi:hypothetical protein
MSSIENVQRTLSHGLASLALTMVLPLAAVANVPTPAPAAAQGYGTVTYGSNFTSTTVDVNHTLNRGYNWYLLDLFGRQSSAAGVKLNADGSVSLLGDNTNAAGQLTSMAQYRGTNTFVGTSFGGGFYMEAVFNFNYADVAKTHPAGTHITTPAFWSLPMEAIVFTGANQWPGQAKGYLHNVEFDFFEADYWSTTNTYGMGLHDWWGIPNSTCGKGMCGLGFTSPSGARATPAGTNLNAYHTYGTLWVPATPTTPGRVAEYFDGVLIGTQGHSWTQYTNQAPTPAGQPWAFGRLDQQHMFFILGTGVGQPFNVQSVTVWQKDGSKNIVN